MAKSARKAAFPEITPFSRNGRGIASNGYEGELAQGQGQEPGQEQGHGSRRTDGGDHCFKHFCWKRAS